MSRSATSTRTPRRRNSLLWSIIGVFLIVIIILGILTVLDMFSDDDATTGTADPPGGASVAQVVQNVDEYEGDEVTVSGEINQVLSPLAFTIGGERFGTGEEILVIGPAPAVSGDEGNQTDFRELDIMQVTGTVTTLNIDEAEQEVGAELDRDALADFSGEPVIIAQGIVHTDRVQPDIGSILENDELTGNLDNYVGDDVSVEGDITQVFDETTFVIDEEILVIDETGSIEMNALEQAESARVSGTAQRIDNVDTDAAADFGGEAVVVASTIHLLPELE